MNFYDRLNVAPDADNATLRESYHREAKKHHPDRHPDDIEGATQRMQEIQHAYSVLKDPEKRAHYERTGDDDTQAEQNPAEALLASILNGLITDAVRADFNILARARAQIKERLTADRTAITVHEHAIKKLEKIIARVTAPGTYNYISMAAGSIAARTKHDMQPYIAAVKAAEGALQLLEGYTDNFIDRVTSPEEQIAHRMAAHNIFNQDRQQAKGFFDFTKPQS